MSRKHGKPHFEGMRKISDYTKSKHTKNNFKTWLNEAKYVQLIDMKNLLKEKIMKYEVIREKEGRIYPLQPSQHPIDNLKILKYKYNLVSNKLNMMVIKNG
jgi:hypothetical protein